MRLFAPLAALAAGVAVLSISACAMPKKPEPPLQVINPDATIPFVNLGGIYSWQPRDDGSILIEGTTRRWYHATFFAPCPEVKFAQKIGVKTDVLDQVDRFSGIIVDGRLCRFKTLEEVIEPKAKATAAPSTPVESGALGAPKPR
jgi:hypothetical protein